MNIVPSETVRYLYRLYDGNYLIAYIYKCAVMEICFESAYVPIERIQKVLDFVNKYDGWLTEEEW